jgi:peptidase M28-like protein
MGTNKNKIMVVIFFITMLLSNTITISSRVILDDNNEPVLQLPYTFPNYPSNDHINEETTVINQPLYENRNSLDLKTETSVLDLINDIEVPLVLGFIEDLVAIGPRKTATESCDIAGAYIYHEFEKMGLEVQYKNWSSSSTLYGSNIEATLHGANPSSEEIYIVCGHYDTVQPSPGADDNGAGTAAVLACASILSQYSFNHTIRFVTFSGEEQGLHGSYHYASEAYEKDEPIKAVLNADMMGYASEKDSETKVIVYDNEPSSWITDVTKDVSQTYNEVINLEVIHGGYSGRSDHASFHNAYYDAIFYFEYEFNPFYHSNDDTIEHMNPSYATNVTKLILGTLAHLSEYVQEQSPNKPGTPIGKSNGKIDEPYRYRSIVLDPNGDDVYVLWDWGDGNTSGWLGPYQSGEEYSSSYQWKKQGSYELRVKAKDIHGQESVWSDSLQLTMPKIISLKVIFLNWLERYPVLYQIINKNV